MSTQELLQLLSHWFLMLGLGFYLVINLQWYHYKIKRVILNHHRRLWHVLYFVMPIGVYFFAHTFAVVWCALYMLSLYFWHRQLDKKLVFTSRVVRFFLILMGLVTLNDTLCFFHESCALYAIVLPLMFTLIISAGLEKLLMIRYILVAKEKLQSMHNLKIIAITASFGKTSVKHFLHQILQDEFHVHVTPRSVNTFAGIVRDINESLNTSHQIYIVEAGAREKGDIDAISQLIQHHYAILGKIGEAHIEYFKTLDNIVETKMEIMHSSRLEKALVYKENPLSPAQKSGRMILFPKDVRNIQSNLESTAFELKIGQEYYPFYTTVLGQFSVINITAAITMAHELGMSIPSIQEKVKHLAPMKHRLYKMNAHDKIILDDSFNGNREGVLEAIRIASFHSGRTIIVTPGLIESSEASNIEIAQAIDKQFDVAIITGEQNSKILSAHITQPHKIILKEKSNLEDVLKGATEAGDLILFANDAPNYI
jgi:UDP-N-acetylmuramoyl-tripeptide--D-alanyl-D-alanine ligase